MVESGGVETPMSAVTIHDLRRTVSVGLKNLLDQITEEPARKPVPHTLDRLKPETNAIPLASGGGYVFSPSRGWLVSTHANLKSVIKELAQESTSDEPLVRRADQPESGIPRGRPSG